MRGFAPFFSPLDSDNNGFQLRQGRRKLHYRVGCFSSCARHVLGINNMNEEYEETSQLSVRIERNLLRGKGGVRND